MKRILVLAGVALLILLPALSAHGINPPTSPTPSSPKTPGAAAGSDSAYAEGQIETIEGGSPAVLTLRLTDGSINIRPLKVNHTLRVDVPAELMRNFQTLKTGDTVRVTGIIRDGRFVVQTLLLTKGRTK
jgi:hypothetical protein